MREIVALEDAQQLYADSAATRSNGGSPDLGALSLSTPHPSTLPQGSPPPAPPVTVSRTRAPKQQQPHHQQQQPQEQQLLQQQQQQQAPLVAPR